LDEIVETAILFSFPETASAGKPTCCHAHDPVHACVLLWIMNRACVVNVPIGK
jgi:hypothetical protein